MVFVPVVVEELIFCYIAWFGGSGDEPKSFFGSFVPVSYTHLDVYKRQVYKDPRTHRFHFELYNFTSNHDRDYRVFVSISSIFAPTGVGLIWCLCTRRLFGAIGDEDRTQTAHAGRDFYPRLLTFSRFLPYTVQFEVGPQFDYNGVDLKEATPVPGSAAEMRDTSRFQSVLTPIPISLSLTSGQTSLILPSLSKANSTLHTPLLLLPRHGDASKYSLNENDVNGFEDFFYNSQKWHKSHVQLEESLKEKLLPHYIQPRSRYLHLNYPSSSLSLIHI